MFVLGYLLQAIAELLHIVLMSAMIVVIARAVLSWVSPDPYNPIVRTIMQLSEPLLYPVRRRLPLLGGIDFSPMLVLLVIIFLDDFLVASLQMMGLRLLQGG
ncbi:MAG: YggT family protein [Zetaproteobacteria bacterium]|nr:MAG: YggT family protein [Zetaproteobacteria bacterium]